MPSTLTTFLHSLAHFNSEMRPIFARSELLPSWEGKEIPPQSANKAKDGGAGKHLENVFSYFCFVFCVLGKDMQETEKAFASPADIKGLTGDEASSLLMLLKRFRAIDERGRPALELKTLAGVEANFLVAARERLKTYLHRIGLCLQVVLLRRSVMTLLS